MSIKGTQDEGSETLLFGGGRALWWWREELGEGGFICCWGHTGPEGSPEMAAGSGLVIAWVLDCNFGSNRGGSKNRRQREMNSLVSDLKIPTLRRNNWLLLVLEPKTKLTCHLPQEHILVEDFVYSEVITNIASVWSPCVLAICSQLSGRR